MHVFHRELEDHCICSGLVWRSRSSCRTSHRLQSPTTALHVRNTWLDLIASRPACKDDCLPCATEVPTDVNVFCVAIACERIHWVARFQRHSATAEFVAEPSHEPRIVIDTQPQRARAQGKHSDHPLFRPVRVGYKLVLWHADSLGFVLPALRSVLTSLALLRCCVSAADLLQLAHGVVRFRLRDCGRGRVRDCGGGRRFWAACGGPARSCVSP